MEIKICNTCLYANYPREHIECTECIKAGLGNYKNWQPKDHTEDNIEKGTGAESIHIKADMHTKEPECIHNKVKIDEYSKTIRLNNGSQTIYLNIRNNGNSFDIRPINGAVFKFQGGHSQLKNWRGVAELILEAVDYLEKGSV
jgi:hypothetical protein